MRTPSLRTRLTVWCSVVVVAVLLIFAVDVLLIQQRIGVRRLDGDLAAAHLQLTNMLREELRELDAPKLAATESQNVLASRTRPIAILGERGETLASNFDVPNLAGVLPAGATQPLFATIEGRPGSWRVRAERVTLEGVPMTLIVASSMNELARDQQEIRHAMFLGIPIALIFAGAGGLWLASIGLRPVTRMARRAANLPLTGDEDLGPPAREDELGQLTRAFNALVARLRAALQTQRQFMTDASHELRNPVSVVRSASDVALSRRHRDEAEYREALTMINAQSRRLGSLVDDMLVLARADAGGYPLRPVDFFLDDAIEECRKAVGVLAADRQVKVKATGESDVAIRGDEELVRRLVLNLLQNAVQHTPYGGEVSVDVSTANGTVCVRVIDSGAGIPQGELERIFERFVQLDPSRRSSGAGLGLTIARWIAEAHHGSLVVESTGPQGTTFCLALPVIAQSAVPASYN
jgi:heavy metal sensor kinase